MIDVHCHLNFKSFAKDYDEVIKRAYDAGVITIINVGTKIDSSQKAVELAQKYENLYAIVGVHPHHADKLTDEGGHPDPPSGGEGTPDDWIKELEQLAKQPKVVGIGEIGMDYYRYSSNGIVDLKLQKHIFEQQIELANKLKLPIQIHNRHAGHDILNIIKHYKDSFQNPPGMFHCMSGNLEFLKSVLQMGFYVGFDGNITYKGLAPGEDTELSELVRHTPLERIVIETDSPYLTPEPHRGSRNEPSYAILIAEFLASLKGVSLDEVRSQTTKNVQRIFNL